MTFLGPKYLVITNNIYIFEVQVKRNTKKLKAVLETSKTTRIKRKSLTLLKRTIMKGFVSKMLVTVAVLFAGFNTASAQSDFYTNIDLDGQTVTGRTIYKYDGYLTPHLKYDYTYDNQRRMSSRTAYLWLDVMNEWVPYYRIDYSYTDGMVNMKYGVWDKRTNDFDKFKEEGSYEATGNNHPQW